MEINSYAACVTGRRRQNNEDNVFLCGQYREDVSVAEFFSCYDGRAPFLCAVSDGMGGEQSGEMASLEAVRTLKEYMNDFDAHCDEYITAANAAVVAHELDGEHIGTTVCTLFISDGRAYVCNIGDSRVYLKRAGALYQLSHDHTQAQQMCDHGIISADEIAVNPHRHELTQYIGIPPEEMLIEPAVAEPFDVEPEDIFLLCSDGLTDMLGDEDIYSILSLGGDAEKLALELIDAAMSAGGKDNTSVIVVRMVPPKAGEILKNAAAKLTAMFKRVEKT